MIGATQPCTCDWDGAPDARRAHIVNPLCPHHGSDAEPDWARMTLAEACALRWRMGRVEYGSINPQVKFVGDSLYELMEELLDAINYAQQGKNEGRLTGALHQDIQMRLVWVAEKVRQEMLMEQAERAR
jgi:hypothetical protein